MNREMLKKIVVRFIVGVLFAIVIYSFFRITGIQDEPLTVFNVASVLFIGGCIGQFNAIFSLDINFSVALSIHFFCTMLLTVVIFLVNGWQEILVYRAGEAFIYFFLSYLFVWLVLKLEQRRKILKINQQLEKYKQQK